MLYLHPAGKKQLRLYAVEREVKVHDLLLEAVEMWAASKGLAGPWRVPSAGPPRRKRRSFSATVPGETVQNLGQWTFHAGWQGADAGGRQHAI